MYTYIYYTRVESVCVCVLVRATRTFLPVWLAAYHPLCAALWRARTCECLCVCMCMLWLQHCSLPKETQSTYTHTHT